MSSSFRVAATLIIVISTGHLDLESKKFLDDEIGNSQTLVVRDMEEGYFVTVPSWCADKEELVEELSGVPEVLRNLILAAYENEVEYIWFDAGADEIDEFPTFEW